LVFDDVVMFVIDGVLTFVLFCFAAGIPVLQCLVLCVAVFGRAHVLALIAVLVLHRTRLDKARRDFLRDKGECVPCAGVLRPGCDRVCDSSRGYEVALIMPVLMFIAIAGLGIPGLMSVVAVMFRREISTVCDKRVMDRHFLPDVEQSFPGALASAASPLLRFAEPFWFDRVS
jgi:hypothetical protein